MSSSVIQKQTDSSEERIRALINSSEQEIQRTLLNAIRDVKSKQTLTEIIRLLENGQIDLALELVDSVSSVLATTITFALVTSADETARLISRVLNRPVAFDQTNSRAVNIMRNARLRLIREFNHEQRNATRQALLDGIQRGLNPREQARAFRDSIGLTTRQVQTVANYRRLLELNSRESLSRTLRDRRFDPTIRRAINTDTPLTGVQIDRMVERYQERLLRYRSEVIARTEALRAVHQGSEEMYSQAIDSGILDPELLIRTWVIADRTRSRDSHRAMSQQERRFGESFTSGAGVPLRYPGDENAPPSETIQCRCVITTRFA